MMPAVLPAPDPILVRRFPPEKNASVLTRCANGHEREHKMTEGLEPATCPVCSQPLDWKYVEGSACVNCDALAIEHPIRLTENRAACSRACALQIDYAEALGRA